MRPSPCPFARDIAPDASRRALARERDPHAGGQAHVLLTGPEGWRGHASREPFGHVGDLLGADRALDENRELIAAPAGDRVLRRHGGAQPAADLGEQYVPGAV